jgi:hypothetical protein
MERLISVAGITAIPSASNGEHVKVGKVGRVVCTCIYQKKILPINTDMDPLDIPANLDTFFATNREFSV